MCYTVSELPTARFLRFYYQVRSRVCAFVSVFAFLYFDENETNPNSCTTILQRISPNHFQNRPSYQGRDMCVCAKYNNDHSILLRPFHCFKFGSTNASPLVGDHRFLPPFRCLPLPLLPPPPCWEAPLFVFLVELSRGDAFLVVVVVRLVAAAELVPDD